MLDTALQAFGDRLMRGPALLFLGQRYLAGIDGDPLLESAAQRHGFDPSMGWPGFVASAEVEDAGSAALDWLAERARQTDPPEWLQAIAEFAWSGAAVTGIDGIWLRALRASWRDVQPIEEETYRPRDARSSEQLNVFALFGTASRANDPRRSAPTNQFALEERRLVASQLLRRIPELMTPRGTLVITAYNSQDFLETRTLAAALAALGPNQVHIFDASSELIADPSLARLSGRQIVTFHEDSFPRVLAQASTAGYLRLGPRTLAGTSRHIWFGDEPHEIPRELWRETSRTASIVDEAAVDDPPALTPRDLARRFSDFLSTSEGRPKWEGLAYGFAYPRRFAEQLQDVALQRVAAKEWQLAPVIVHGQTGTGKTVAMQSLAFNLGKLRRYAVLYVDRRPESPRQQSIESFCQWAEDAGADGTLIAWDGMRDPEEYTRLANALTGRGRRVVVVGTSYTLTEEETRGSRFIKAPARLAPDEVEPFVDFVARFDSDLGRSVAEHRDRLDETFLVALYRLLPSAQYPVRVGVTREAVFTESEMERRAVGLEPARPRNALQAAMFAAGLLDASKLAEQDSELAGERLSVFQHLTGLVMVPGQFGLHVPLELLLRTLGEASHTDFLTVLDRVDMIRWYDDGYGNFVLGARNSLEAEIVVRARAGGASQEVELGTRLIGNLREHGVSGERELEFCIRLVQELTRRGRGAYVPHYGRLAEALRLLREERGIVNPRLMLQEANLLRDSVRQQGYEGQEPPDLTKLEDAIEVLDDALDEEELSAWLRSQLLTELASAKGTLARQLLEQTPGELSKARSLFEELREDLGQAQVTNPGNFYPLDVLGWATKDLVELGLLEGAERLEALTEVMHRFQLADPSEFDQSQQNRYFSRQLDIADLLGDEETAEDVLDELRARGSAAGVYLRAIRRAGLPIRETELTAQQMEAVSEAFSILETEHGLVFEDGRAMSLYFNLWWMGRTRVVPMRGERIVLPLAERDWRTALTYLDILDRLDDTQPPWRAFLRRYCCFRG